MQRKSFDELILPHAASAGHANCYHRPVTDGFCLLSDTVAHRQEIAMNLKPIGDRIIVRRFQSEEKSRGGIVLPDAAKNKPQKGEVLAVGPGKVLKDGTRRPLQLKEGDIVLFTSWAGDEFKDRRNTDEILVMHEEDVLAVLDK
jgi:chaperonin GroES